MKKYLSPYSILFIVMSIAAAKGQTENISLKDTEVWALKSSYTAKALEAEGDTIGNKMKAQRS
ncbi:MAG: hypothetical protein ACOYL6_19235 [Bacteriovoracaceae bacterium]